MRPAIATMLLSGLLTVVPVHGLDFQPIDTVRLGDIDPLDTEGNLGVSMAASGPWVFAGSWLQTRRFGQGYVFRIDRDALSLTPVGTLRPAEFDPFIAINATSNAGQFGHAMAASGDWLAVSAPSARENADGSGGTPGAVFMYRNTGSGTNPWLLQQRLVPTAVAGTVTYDAYGLPVAMDGELLAVGAPLADLFDAGAAHLDAAGAVDVWQRSNGVWTFLQRVTSPSPAIQDRFGYAVALRGDVLLVGAPLVDDSELVTEAGRAYVFRRTPGGAFGPALTLQATVREDNDEFGSAVAIAESALFVGTQRGADALTGGNSLAGSFHVFEPAGDGWIESGEQLGYDDVNVQPWGPGLLVSHGLLAASVPADVDGTVSVFEVDGATLALADTVTPALPEASSFGISLAMHRFDALRVLAVGAMHTNDDVQPTLDAGSIEVLVYDERIFRDGFES